MSKRFSLDSSDIQKFNTYLSETLESGKQNYMKMLARDEQNEFENKILDLRALKYGRLLVKILQEELKIYTKVLVERIRQEQNQSIVHLTFIGIQEDIADSIIKNAISKAPLSKYEISPVISFQNEISIGTNWLCYSITNSHSYMRDVDYNDPRVRILSPIKVDFTEKDYD